MVPTYFFMPSVGLGITWKWLKSAFEPSYLLGLYPSKLCFPLPQNQVLALVSLAANNKNQLCLN